MVVLSIVGCHTAKWIILTLPWSLMCGKRHYHWRNQLYEWSLPLSILGKPNCLRIQRESEEAGGVASWHTWTVLKELEINLPIKWEQRTSTFMKNVKRRRKYPGLPQGHPCWGSISVKQKRLQCNKKNCSFATPSNVKTLKIRRDGTEPKRFQHRPRQNHCTTFWRSAIIIASQSWLPLLKRYNQLWNFFS